MHTHDACEIYIFLYGRGKFLVEGNEYKLSNGDILLMRPAEAHYIDIDPNYPYERLSIHFNHDMFKGIDTEGLLLRPFNERAAGYLNRYSRDDFKPEFHKIIIKRFTSSGEDKYLNISSALFMLLNEIYKIYNSSADYDELETSVQRIVRYVNEHSTDNITLDDICSKFYISKPQLCRVFKSATGSTVQNYINAKRLVNAKQLLASGVPPVKVSALCGYNDYSVFYRAFCKQYKTTPKEEYKKK